jgi:hypothetical protein
MATTESGETALQRYTRDVASQSADRKTRNYASQPDERLGREYVAPDGTSPLDDLN